MHANQPSYERSEVWLLMMSVAEVYSVCVWCLIEGISQNVDEAAKVMRVHTKLTLWLRKLAFSLVQSSILIRI